MCRFIPEAFEHARVAARKIPNVARTKVVRLGLPGRIDHRRAHTTFQHKRPSRSRCVPVQLAHHAGFKLHRYASDSFRDWQLLYRCFLAKTVPKDFSLRFFQFEFERRQFFPRQQRVWNVVSKTAIAHESTFLKRDRCDDQANPSGQSRRKSRTLKSPARERIRPQAKLD
jgi:hypothetical protein